MNGEESEALQQTRRPRPAQASALRCRIVAAAAEGRCNNEIAAALICHAATASKWRRRSDEHRRDMPADNPQPNPPREIADVGGR